MRGDFAANYAALQDLQSKYVVIRVRSVIVSPLGKKLAGLVWNQSRTLQAYVDNIKSEILESKTNFGPPGHYSKRDLLKLKINEDA